MNRLEWYEEASAMITADVEGFYRHMYGATLKPIGKSYRITPCPRCGHKGCCTVTPHANMGGCFSAGCDFHGTHINMLFTYLNDKADGIRQIADYLGLPYPEFSSPEEEARYLHGERIHKIRKVAVKYYGQQLMAGGRELDYQVKVRKRTIDEISRYGIGLARGYLELHKGLLGDGFTKEEIKEANIWIPEGLITYPIHNRRNNIIRINTKNPFKVAFDPKEGEEKGDVIEGFSRGDKAWMINPNATLKRVILVEGENDHITTMREVDKEELDEDVGACCGNLSEEQLIELDKLLEKAKTEMIYTFFDNDDAGQAYTDKINARYPHIDVRQIKYSAQYNDPDIYFNDQSNPTKLADLMKNAVKLSTPEYKIFRDKNVWILKTREFELQFDVQGKNRANSIVGDITFLRDGEIDDMAKEASLDKFKKAKPFNFKLLDYIEAYFNKDINDKPLSELIDVYKFCKHKQDVIRRMAEILHEEEDAREEYVLLIRRGLRDEVADIVLKEMNELQNRSIKSFVDIPKIRVGQFFSVKNNDAFMYYTNMKQDGDAIRRLPYLISNKKKIIRLDLFKRKDEQCLLLIENKYELPFEVPQAILEVQETSLSQHWVARWIADEIPAEEIEPNVLVGRLEGIIRRMYIFNDDVLYKIIAIYIYSTYFYELFAEMPYLLINGKKGSGKTILDTIMYLFCFNAKHSINTTEAALFRSITFEGGTFILDEIENMTSRTKNADSTMATILKGGYSRSGKVYRCNTEKGNMIEGFDVYGPKIISNIFGVEDIIADRCITINTFEAKVSAMQKIEDPKEYAQERMEEVREITSKCCISGLTHFQKLFTTFKSNSFTTGNARLSQILKPLLSIALLCGQEYVDALIKYYEDYISASKEEIERGTPEGLIREILQNISEELLGQAHKHYTMNDIHKYTEDIKYVKHEGYFELNQMHLKTFYEECNPGVQATFPEINSWIKRVLPMNLKEDKRRTSTTITNEDLLKEFNGMRKIRVNVYRFYIKDLLDQTKAGLDKDTAKEELMASRAKSLLFDPSQEGVYVPPF